MAMEDATLIQRINNRFVLQAKAGGKQFPLQGEMMVGRESECAIPLDSGHISRFHAKINVSSNGVYVEDLHSTNGTSVNGQKIKGRVKLSLGDEVGFDDLIFKLTSDMPDDADATILAPRKQHATQREAEEQAQQPRKAVAPTPIRPSLVKDKPLKIDSASASERPKSPQTVFPSADEIDLERPLTTRDALADEAQIEKHLQQRFHELDALMDLPPLEEVLSESAIEPEPDSPEPPLTTVEQPAIAVANDSDAALPPATDPEEQHLPAVLPQDGDRTQILSGAQLDQFIERHRYDYDLNIGSGPRLIVTTAPLRGKLFSLQDVAPGTSVQLGRDADAEIYLNDRTISTDHARLTLSDGQYVLTTTHAKNGMQINGVSEKRVELNHDDRIQIGRTELVFKTDLGLDDAPRPELDDPLVKGHGRRYSMMITAIALIVLVGAIIATAQ